MDQGKDLAHSDPAAEYQRKAPGRVSFARASDRCGSGSTAANLELVVDGYFTIHDLQ